MMTSHQSHTAIGIAHCQQRSSLQTKKLQENEEWFDFELKMSMRSPFQAPHLLFLGGEPPAQENT